MAAGDGAWDRADATVELDEDVAWRLFTKGISKEEARRPRGSTGDEALADGRSIRYRFWAMSGARVMGDG
jgi:hypothetical protein